MKRFPKRLWGMLLAVLVFSACGGEEAVDSPPKPAVFEVVDTNFTPVRMVVPDGYEAKSLFRMGDPVRVDWANTERPAKGKHDFMAYIPIAGSSTHGILWTNHEAFTPDSILGDGGGASVLEVYRDSTEGWKVIGFPHAIDFRPVGGTMANCLGGVTPWGTILTSEEVEPPSNRWLNRDSVYIFRDTSDFNGLPRHLNFGWMVEVDPHKRTALRKLYSMGRFMHEGNYCMDDGKTVYMMDDAGPGAFFKFVAEKAGDYSEGQLYAYQQSEDGNSGNWLKMPRSRDSLCYARKWAFKMGATIFIRMEDIELMDNGTFIITETGLDTINMTGVMGWGGRLANHLKKFDVGNNIIDDKYGRLLRFDPKTNKLSVMLEGGAAEKDKSIHFSNPDNMAIDYKRNMVVIHEDLVGLSHGRVPRDAWPKVVNEVYMLDLSIENPTLDDLQRFAIAPLGSESTGPVFTPDFSTLFFNIQHPLGGNPPPFNRDGTYAVTGFPEAL